MKSWVFKALFPLLLTKVSIQSVPSFAFVGARCGTSCMTQMQGICPTCNYSAMPMGLMPWGIPAPYYWNTGPMMFSNFYAPGPWNYGPFPQRAQSTEGPIHNLSPGVLPQYYPGNGDFFAAKPNLYLLGPSGVSVHVTLKFKDAETNWLAAVPAHGLQGWKATIAGNDRVRVNDVTYGYLYSDYRAFGRSLQDTEGFCAPKGKVIGRMALEMKTAGFSEREIAHFMEYWTVKLPKSESYCVYPQDERQLDQVAVLEISPKPVHMRRLLFLVQVKEGLKKNGGKFTRPPQRAWRPMQLRIPASDTSSGLSLKDRQGIVVHEWGVGFLTAKR